MESILTFFNSPFFIIFSGVTIIITSVGILYTIYLIGSGILPVLYRLGMGLAKRKIAIFASTEFVSLKDMLVDSKIFAAKNIIQIGKNDIDKAADMSVFLVHWRDYNDKLADILRVKKDSTVLVVYAPQNEGRIDDSGISNINGKRNSIIVNFRGRLLNDILVSLITTKYK